MHGCIHSPEDIVLTRDDYLGYNDRRAALTGTVQSLLFTLLGAVLLSPLGGDVCNTAQMDQLVATYCFIDARLVTTPEVGAASPSKADYCAVHTSEGGPLYICRCKSHSMWNAFGLL